MPDTVVLVVTASRDWDQPVLMWTALGECLEWARSLGKTLIVRHGGAPGGDQLASLFAQITPGCVNDPYPADWEGPCQNRDGRCPPGHRRRNKRGREYCPMAGHYRNEDMVAAGLDRGLACIKDRSRGAAGCAELMKDAGVKPRIYRA
jgi:hypothetical protein